MTDTLTRPTRAKARYDIHLRDHDRQGWAFLHAEVLDFWRIIQAQFNRENGLRLFTTKPTFYCVGFGTDDEEYVFSFVAGCTYPRGADVAQPRKEIAKMAEVILGNCFDHITYEARDPGTRGWD